MARMLGKKIHPFCGRKCCGIDGRKDGKIAKRQQKRKEKRAWRKEQ